MQFGSEGESGKVGNYFSLMKEPGRMTGVRESMQSNSLLFPLISFFQSV